LYDNPTHARLARYVEPLRDNEGYDGSILLLSPLEASGNMSSWLTVAVSCAYLFLNGTLLFIDLTTQYPQLKFRKYASISEDHYVD
jgi:hypothetical protein